MRKSPAHPKTWDMRFKESRELRKLRIEKTAIDKELAQLRIAVLVSFALVVLLGISLFSR